MSDDRKITPAEADRMLCQVRLDREQSRYWQGRMETLDHVESWLESLRDHADTPVTDALRKRAEEAAWDFAPGWVNGAIPFPTGLEEEREIQRDAFVEGFLAHAAQQPVVVCICGSTRFRSEMAEANRRLTMEGNVVLAPGAFGHDGDPLTEADKEALDALHFRKIDMADRVVVVAPGAYIGSSTTREIAYAKANGKPVEAWTDFSPPAPQHPTREQIVDLAEWHETKAEKARRYRPEIDDQNRVMDKAAEVHEDAARRLHALLEGAER